MLIRPVLDQPLRSPLRSAVDEYARSAVANPYAAFNTFVQSLYLGGETGIWYDGTDPTQRAVNSDGSGGQPALGAKFGWLNDKSGGGRPAIQATAGAQPIAQSSYVLFQEANAVTVGDPVRSMAPATASGANQQASTGIVILDFNVTPFAALPVAGFYNTGTNSPIPCRYGFIAWRTNSSGNMDFYICDVNNNITPSGAISAIACRAPTLGGISGGFGLFYQYAQFNSRLSDANFLQLRTLASQACGASNFSTDVVAGIGDSNMYGYRLSDGKSWLWNVAGSTTAKVYNFGVVGGVMNAEMTMGRLASIKGAGKSVLLWTAAQNDVNVSIAADVVEMYCGGMYFARQLGWRTMASTYYGSSSAVQAFNTAVKLRQYDAYDYLCDFASDSRLTNTADSAYFWADAVHLKDTARDVAVTVAKSACANALAYPFADFTATPRIGSTVNAAFTNASVGASSYAWDFTNDSSTDSTATNPTNNYTVTGTPDVRLTATNASGSAQRVRRFYINVQPSPSWVTSNLVCGFIANAGQTSAGGFLSAWADSIMSSGISISQATGANQPAVDGFGIVTFDGSNDYLQSGVVASLGTRMTVFLLCKINTATAGRYLCDGRVVNAANLRLYSSTDLMVANQVDIAQTSGIAAGAWQSIHYGFASDMTNITKMMMAEIEGKDRVLGNWLGGDAVAANGVTLGARYNGTSPVAMSVKAMLCYSAGLTRAQMAQNKAMAATL